MLGFLTSGFTLNAGIKLVNEARAADAGAADALFQQGYDKFAEISSTNGKYAQAVYHWGFGLLHQANTKSGNEAIKMLEQAIDKFTVCLNVKPDYMGAAMDGGVAYLTLAKLKGVALDNELYAKAKESFDKAEAIQEGCASYNLACLYAMNNEADAAHRALEKARELGLVPDPEVVLADEDLANIHSQPWFDRFIESISIVEEREKLSHGFNYASGKPSKPKTVESTTETVEAAQAETKTADDQVEASTPEPVVETLDESTEAETSSSTESNDKADTKD